MAGILDPNAILAETVEGDSSHGLSTPDASFLQGVDMSYLTAGSSSGTSQSAAVGESVEGQHSLVYHPIVSTAAMISKSRSQTEVSRPTGMGPTPSTLSKSMSTQDLGLSSSLRFDYPMEDDHSRIKNKPKKTPPTVYREQDRFVPINNTGRVMRNAVPKNAKISKDAKQCMQECISEFISFLTSEASDRCIDEKRKTITGDDILYSLSTLGFDNYVQPLQQYLKKYREFIHFDKPGGREEEGGQDGRGGDNAADAGQEDEDEADSSLIMRTTVEHLCEDDTMSRTHQLQLLTGQLPAAATTTTTTLSASQLPPTSLPPRL